jgi:hypothetical protein
MADVGDNKDEDDGSNGSSSNNCPETPYESTARIGYTEETHADAPFDRCCASCIKELGNEEELPWSGVRL